MPQATLILDTSVLINFLRINRIELLSCLQSHMVITEHVRSEVVEHYSEQRAVLEECLATKLLFELVIDEVEEIEAIHDFRTQVWRKSLGWGECSAIIAASRRGYRLGLDDRRAVRAVRLAFPELEIRRTDDLVVEMILENVLSIAEADEIKSEWEKRHKFKLPFQSFAELLELR